MGLTASTDLMHHLIWITSISSFIPHSNEEESMGLELVDTLVELLEKTNMQHLFTHYCRISKVKPGEKTRKPVGKRMDEKAYREDFEKFEAAGNVEVCYVCGPPIMQEHFD